MIFDKTNLNDSAISVYSKRSIHGRNRRPILKAVTHLYYLCRAIISTTEIRLYDLTTCGVKDIVLNVAAKIILGPEDKKVLEGNTPKNISLKEKGHLPLMLAPRVVQAGQRLRFSTLCSRAFLNRTNLFLQ